MVDRWQSAERTNEILQIRMMLVTFRQQHILHGNRPLNRNVRIIPCNATFCLRMIKLIAFILENGLVTQS